MGNIDDAVRFFGEGFNNIYPLIMVVYTLLVASNFFDRVVGFFGNWKRLRFQTEADDDDGFDPSGLIILQKGKDAKTSVFSVVYAACLVISSHYILLNKYSPFLLCI